MGAWIKDTTFKKRNEFREYIYGLIRHEIHKGEDDDRRLEVLSKIYYDLLYVEDLRDSSGYKKKVKDKDDLTQALDKIRELEESLSEFKTALKHIVEGIDGNKTKKEILNIMDEVKKNATISNLLR